MRCLTKARHDQTTCARYDGVGMAIKKQEIDACKYREWSRDSGTDKEKSAGRTGRLHQELDIGTRAPCQRLDHTSH